MVSTLKKKWVSFVKRLLDSEGELKAPGKHSVRFATFNVHYFTDVYEKNAYADILAVMKSINADYLLLNEVIMGGGKVSISKRTTVDLSKWDRDVAECGYHSHTIVCNVVPSWFTAPYGNMMLIHKRVPCKDIVCSSLNETIHTFAKSKKTVKVSGKHEGFLETRCMIRVNFKWKSYDVVLYGVHLDVASEDERLKQITYIVQQIEAESEGKRTERDRSLFAPFIMGDFNTFDKTQYTKDDDRRTNDYGKDNGKVASYLKKHDFYDCATLNRQKPPEMTTWSNTRVDFIWGRNISLKSRIKFDVVPTLASDHLPVVVTMS